MTVKEGANVFVNCPNLTLVRSIVQIMDLRCEWVKRYVHEITHEIKECQQVITLNKKESINEA